MKKKKRRRFRVGDVIKCRDEFDMKQKIKNFASMGVDVKPIFGEMAIEVIDIDKN